MTPSTKDQRHWAEINGARLRYRTAGDGPPLLLMHAGICDSRMWDEQIEFFARTRRIVAPDFRGYGESKMVAGGYSHRADLRGLMDRLDIARAPLVAVSMSGRTALDIALETPGRVSALVLVGSALPGYSFIDPGMAEADAAVENAVAAGRFDEAAEIEIKTWVAGPRRQLDAVDPALRRLVREMLLPIYAVPPDLGRPQPFEPPAIGRLGEIRVPTLVIVGDEDMPDIIRIADVLVAGIRGARLEIMRGTAHLPNMEQPAVFNRLVGEFLAALPGAQS